MSLCDQHLHNSICVLSPCCKHNISIPHWTQQGQCGDPPLRFLAYPFIPGDQASEQSSLLEGQVLWVSASWGQQKTDLLTHFGLSCRHCRCYPGTGEVIGQVECWSLCPCWWSPWSVFSRPQFEGIYQIILSANAYDEFSCKLSQNPYFSVTNLLFSQNWRLGFCRITVFHCPESLIKPCVSDSIFSTAARRLVQTNFENTVVLFIYISKYLTKSNFMTMVSVHWKHKPKVQKPLRRGHGLQAFVTRRDT